MSAIRLWVAGDPQELVLEEVDVPRPGSGEALVRVHAAALTRDELTWTADRLPATPSFELSGMVADVGPDVGDVTVGDEVYGLIDFGRDGAAADYVSVSTESLAPKPQTVDHVHSAAIPLAGLSAWEGLFDHGRLEAGERILVLGAAGGVGHLAIQLAAQRGAYVVGAASGSAVDHVRELGADETLDVASLGSHDEVERFDLIFDTAGGDLLRRSARWLRGDGRLVSVAEEPPAVGDQAIASYFVVQPSRDRLVELARLVDAGAVRPMIDSVFPLRDAVAAFERTAARGKRGKVVLQVAATSSTR